MKIYLRLPYFIQFLIALLIGLVLAFVVMLAIYIIITPNISSYVASVSLWTATFFAYLTTRNNRKEGKLYYILILILVMVASVNTLGSLRRLGLIEISPMTLTRLFSAAMVFTGITLTWWYGRKYRRIKADERKTKGMESIKIYYPKNQNTTVTQLQIAIENAHTATGQDGWRIHGN